MFLGPLVAAVALAGSTAAAPTDLRIVAWPSGPEGEAVVAWRLRCEPTGGTLPRAAAACRQLGALARPFAPVPKDLGCTQIYGGPQVARVTGTLEGRRIWAKFKRNDGCEIARWNRHRFLFPGVVTG